MIQSKDEAIALLKEENFSCVIWKKDHAICDKDLGIKPLMKQLRLDKQAFSGAIIADRIVGKAAALMTVLGGAVFVFGSTMSETAIEIFDKNNIPYEYDSLVPFILNRTKDDKCPMEKTVENIEDPTIAFEALEKTIQKLMSAKS